MAYTEKDRIADLLRDCTGQITPRASQFLIEDPEAWYQNLSNDFDRSRKRNSLIELRKVLSIRLERYINETTGKVDYEKIVLLKKIRLLVENSDRALIEVAAFVGMKPSEGLFDFLSIIDRMHNNPEEVVKMPPSEKVTARSRFK